MKKSIVMFILLLGLAAFPGAAQFTGWSTPVNMGPVVNSPYVDSCVSVSKNNLSLFFFSNRYAKNSNAAWHLYVAKRSSVDEPWGAPQEIVGFNDGYAASCPALSPDEHRMYFSTVRPDGCGSGDIWVSRRRDRRDDFGWEPPQNIGCAPSGPNSVSGEGTPYVFEDETGTEVMYLQSGRPGGAGGVDIYMTRMGHDDVFGPASLVAELCTSYGDGAPAIRRGGLEIIFISNRPGGLGDYDLWRSTRSSTSDAWSAPVNETVLNSPAYDGGKMSFSFDGRQLYLRSNRDGNNDLYVATREKLHGGGK